MKARFYEVSCRLHGKQLNKMDESFGYRHVIVGRPKNRHDRRDKGCPVCAKQNTSKS